MPVDVERAYPTPMSNSPLLPLLLFSLVRQRHTPDGSLRIKKEYDYVIVGGGTAGSVVASRLSEKPCVSVLLLEAGGKPPLLTEVPAISEYFWFTDVDWQYKTAPQKHTGRALVNGQVVWPSGKMLGGSSSMNNMLYVRGSRKNYDEWAAKGAKGWSFKDVFPYFFKLENNKDYRYIENGYHTRGGPITVHQPRYESELKEAIGDAAESLGYKITDTNAARQTGFYDLQATLRESQRCSTAKAYLVPAENRTNFDILPNAKAKKIIIRNHKARGVRFAFRGHTYEVKARREVILSAGTVNTAQLLMLSGVGPKKALQRLNIPVIEDLPVGQNLHEHGGTHIPYVLSSHIPEFEEKISNHDCIQQYIHNRTGPLASTSGIQYLAFLKGRSTHSHRSSPSVELYFSEMPSSIVKTHFGLKPEVYRKLYGPYEKEPLLMCTVSVLQPRSRGSVTLRSKNPHESPIIDPNYLSHPSDLEDLLQGMKTCQRIVKSRPLWKLGAAPFKTMIPGCEKYAYDEDKYLTCQARSVYVTLHNAVGTAKMGDPWDPTTVVDPKLRVKNIEGLRVVDASVMPTVPSGNINVPTIMLAEKASDIIKETIDCYKAKDDWDDDEPEDASGWSDHDDESWEDEKKWKEPGHEETIWVDDEDHWKTLPNKETVWVEEGESWKNPKDIVWVDDGGKWEDPEDKETTWVDHGKPWKDTKEEEVIWKDEEKWEKPKHKDTIWVNDEKTKKKITDTVWVKDVYTERPQQSWTEKPWEEKEKRPIEDYFKSSSHTSHPENKYPSHYQDDGKKHKPNDGKYPLKDFLKDPIELSTIPADDTYYYKTTLPYSWYKEQTQLLTKQQKYPTSSEWNGKKEPWKQSTYNATEDIRELVKLAQQKNKGMEYPTSHPWKDSDGYGVTKSVDELVKEAERGHKTWTESIDNKEQPSEDTDELVELAMNGDYSKSYEPWTESSNYEVTENIDELIKKAERDNKHKKSHPSLKRSDNYDFPRKVEELIKMAKLAPERWTKR